MNFMGHFNNTPEQYFLFKKEKQAELFQENQNIDSLLLCSNEKNITKARGILPMEKKGTQAKIRKQHI